MQKKFQFLRQRLFAAKTILGGVFSIARQGCVAANNISGSISNVVGLAGAVGKCERVSVREGVLSFLFGVIAQITMHTIFEHWE
jgi:hypothetical protein